MKSRLWVRTLAGLAVACLPAFAATAQTKVVAAIPSAILPYMAGVVYAKALGFYKDEGLDVEFVSVNGSGVLIPQVVNKSVTFGLIVPDLPLVAMSKGQPYPIQFFYNGYPRNHFEFVVPENSPIKSLADLKGKKLGVGALSFGNIPMSRAMLAQSGVTWMKDVEVLPVGIGPAAWKRLSGGEIDALNLFAHEHERMALAGTPIRRLPEPKGFDKVFANSWIAHKDDVEKNPKMVEGFGRAYAKGYYACTLDPEKCLRAFWVHDPASRPAPDKEAEWIASNLPVLKIDIRNATTGLSQGRYGAFDPDAWTQIVKGLKEGELIPDDKLDLNQLYTNKFVAKINDFDHASVKARVDKGL